MADPEDTVDAPVAAEGGQESAPDLQPSAHDGADVAAAHGDVQPEPTTDEPPPPIAAEAGQAGVGQEPTPDQEQPAAGALAAEPAAGNAAPEPAAAEGEGATGELTMDEAEVAAKLAELEQPSGPPALYGKAAAAAAGVTEPTIEGSAAEGNDSSKAATEVNTDVAEAAAEGSAAGGNDGANVAAEGSDAAALPTDAGSAGNSPAADNAEDVAVKGSEQSVAAAAGDAAAAAAEPAAGDAAAEPAADAAVPLPEAAAAPSQAPKPQAPPKSAKPSSDTEGSGVRTHHTRSKSKREKDIESLGDAVHPPSPSKIKQEVWLDGTYKTEKGRVITAQELCQSVERMTNAHISKYLAAQQAAAGAPGAPGAPAGTAWNSKTLNDDELDGMVSRLYQTRSREEALAEAGKIELLQLKFDETGKETWVPVKKSSIEEQKEYLCTLYDRCWESKKRTEAELAAKYLQPLGRPRKA